MPRNFVHCLTFDIVLSPTDIVGTLGDSNTVISLSGNALTKVAAVIQPAEPPPTIKILSHFIIIFFFYKNF